DGFAERPRDDPRLGKGDVSVIHSIKYSSDERKVSPTQLTLTRPTAAADLPEEAMMNVPLTESIRNVAVVSNAGSGTTSLVEALAYCTGTLSSPGSVLAGNTVSDFEPEEVHHRSSFNTTVLRCCDNGTVLNLLDTPGAPSFVADVRAALRIADGVVLV